MNGIVTLSLPGRDARTTYVRPGAPLGFPNSSTSRVLCAFQPSVMEKLQRASLIPLIQDSLFNELGDLLESLERTRDCFFAITCNTKGDNLGSVAAPVFDKSNKLLGAVSIVAITETFDDPAFALASREVRKTAQNLSEQMGSDRWSSANPDYLCVPDPSAPAKRGKRHRLDRS